MLFSFSDIRQRDLGVRKVCGWGSVIRLFGGGGLGFGKLLATRAISFFGFGELISLAVEGRKSYLFWFECPVTLLSALRRAGVVGRFES